MAPKVWVNQQLSAAKHKRRKKINRKSAHRQKLEAQAIAAEKPTQAGQNHIQVNNSIPPNMVESFLDIAGKLDLLRISNKLAEVNQVMEQVNGLIHQFQGYSPPVQAPAPPEHVRAYSTSPHTYTKVHHGQAFRDTGYGTPAYQVKQGPPYGY